MIQGTRSSSDDEIEVPVRSKEGENEYIERIVGPQGICRGWSTASVKMQMMIQDRIERPEDGTGTAETKQSRQLE
jgi:hypothetical protein